MEVQPELKSYTPSEALKCACKAFMYSDSAYQQSKDKEISKQIAYEMFEAYLEQSGNYKEESLEVADARANLTRMMETQWNTQKENNGMD